jgi:hypothetical protein
VKGPGTCQTRGTCRVAGLLSKMHSRTSCDRPTDTDRNAPLNTPNSLVYKTISDTCTLWRSAQHANVREAPPASYVATAD